jgi:hypothetical protein
MNNVDRLEKPVLLTMDDVARRFGIPREMLCDASAHSSYASAVQDAELFRSKLRRNGMEGNHDS